VPAHPDVFEFFGIAVFGEDFFDGGDVEAGVFVLRLFAVLRLAVFSVEPGSGFAHFVAEFRVFGRRGDVLEL